MNTIQPISPRIVRAASACAALTISAITLNAATLVQDDFTIAGSAVSLHGTTPDTTVGGATWIAQSAITTGNGTVADTRTVSTNAGAYLNLGNSYFLNNPGVYTLSADITFSSGSASNVWGIGFSRGSSTAAGDSMAFSADPGEAFGRPWLFIRATGDVALRNGSTTNIATTTTSNPAGTRTLTLVLDTSGAQWTFAAYLGGVNGTQIGTTQTIAADAALDHIGITSVNPEGSANTGRLDNFQLDFVPEPSSSLLLVVSALGFVTRRRRL